jgi:DNA-binding HxlR family transcriptional regulator
MKQTLKDRLKKMEEKQMIEKALAPQPEGRPQLKQVG